MSGFWSRLFGSKPDVTMSNGTEALMRAAINRNADSLRALIAAGADVNAKDNDGYTALIFSACNGNADCAKALIAAGANLDAKNEYGRTALIGAAEYCQGGSSFDEPDPDLTDGPHTVKALIAAGADVNAKDNKGETALMKAVTNGNHVDSVKALMAAGADVNAKDNRGFTALMSARYADGIKALIAAGANLDAKNNEGATALIEACYRDDANKVQALIAAGADVNAKDNAGETALMCAKSYVVKDILRAAISGKPAPASMPEVTRRVIATANSVEDAIAAFLRGMRMLKPLERQRMKSCHQESLKSWGASEAENRLSELSEREFAPLLKRVLEDWFRMPGFTQFEVLVCVTVGYSTDYTEAEINCRVDLPAGDRRLSSHGKVQKFFLAYLCEGKYCSVLKRIK